jgi:hypothetical protein
MMSRVANADRPARPVTSVDKRAHAFHAALTCFNRIRLSPALPDPHWESSLRGQMAWLREERLFIERERAAIQARAALAPLGVSAFMAWFDELRRSGPGQGDLLFPWLAEHADLEQMRWFLRQEAASEAGFDDLVALTQIRLPARPKLEMARNYWDEMGRGHEAGMHGRLLARTVRDLQLHPSVESTVWESLALANLMAGLASNRCYTYHAVGALGVIEMTAPGRVALVNAGMKRLALPSSTRLYFQLHAGLDIKHSLDWNREVIAPLVTSDPALAIAIAEGALMRLTAGARCFRRYRLQFRVVAAAPASRERTGASVRLSAGPLSG